MEATPTTDSSPTTATPGPGHDAPDPSGSEPAPPKNSFSRSRRGTVPQLPKILRDRIKQMLDDGLTYQWLLSSLLVLICEIRVFFRIGVHPCPSVVAVPTHKLPLTAAGRHLSAVNGSYRQLSAPKLNFKL